MGTDEENARRLRARELAAQAARAGDETGWFETLYAEAEAGRTVVPWADGEPNPHLVEWAGRGPADGTGRRALVVGCGLGYDAEYLAGLGYTVTAFDIAPTATERAVRENPGTKVTYVTADLLALPASWAAAFDLVFEAYTVQPLYGPVRARALAALSVPVAPGGTLLVIARATNDPDPDRDPATMPWPLTRAELNLAGGPLRLAAAEQFLDQEDPPKLRWRAEFRRDATKTTAPKITPFLMFEGNAEEAMTFYVSLFRDAEVVSITRYGADGPGREGSVQRATFALAGTRFMCIDSPAPHDFTFTPAVSLYVQCENQAEIDRLFAALAERGTELMPLGDYGFSSRFGWVNDRFGVSWQLDLPE